jgi:tetratricopeptide (TPR) repeat protein
MGWRRTILLSALLLIGCGGMVNHHAEGLRLLHEGRQSEAWEAFERGYEADPRSPYSLNNMGLVLEMRDGDLIGAAQLYREAIQACEAYKGDAPVKGLEKMARENLQRVLYKLQSNPMHRVSACGILVTDPEQAELKAIPYFFEAVRIGHDDVLVLKRKTPVLQLGNVKSVKQLEAAYRNNLERLGTLT